MLKYPINYYNMRSLFPILQSIQRVCRLLISFEPPLEKGFIWSICSSICRELRPQKTHLYLSLFKTVTLTDLGI